MTTEPLQLPPTQAQVEEHLNIQGQLLDVIPTPSAMVDSNVMLPQYPQHAENNTALSQQNAMF